MAGRKVTATPVVSANLPAVTYGYDQASNMTRMVDARANVWLQTYNSWNLAQDRVEPATTAQPVLADRVFTTFYDSGGLAVRDVLAGAVTVNRTFDNLGRVTGEVSVAAADAPAGSRAFTYDEVGRVKFGVPWVSRTVGS